MENGYINRHISVTTQKSHNKAHLDLSNHNSNNSISFSKFIKSHVFNYYLPDVLIPDIIYSYLFIIILPTIIALFA